MKTVKLLPKGFTDGLKQISGDFLKGVWAGMGPDIRKKGPEKQQRKTRVG